jgi:hypothetical protein
MRCGEWIRINANLKISLLAAGASFCPRAWKVSAGASPCYTSPPSPADSPPTWNLPTRLAAICVGIGNFRKIAAPGTSAGRIHFA